MVHNNQQTLTVYTLHPRSNYRVESGMLDRVKSRPENGGKVEFLVDCKEAGMATGLLHVLNAGQADPAFATVKAHGSTTVRRDCYRCRRWREVDNTLC